MTATLPDVTPRKKTASSLELDAAKELVRLAKEQGMALTGPDGLLKALTKTVLETALNEELTSIWAMTSTIRRERGRATSATAPGRRRC
jgi:transposase-like protein